jgi:hypothetical protein
MPSSNVSNANDDPPHFLLGVFALAFISLAAGVAGLFLMDEVSGPRDGQTFVILYTAAFACLAFAVSFAWLNVGDRPLARLMRSTVLALISAGLVLAGGYGTVIVALIIQASNCPPGVSDCS